MEIAIDEHILVCSICGRNLIVKDSVNNGVAFLSHLKFDHYIRYKVQQMSDTRVKKRDATIAISQQTLEQSV
jgi:competence transcription factor ComK